MTKITWDSSEFLKAYHEALGRVKRGDALAYSRIKTLRAEEFANTVALVNQGWYESESGKTVGFPSDAPMQHGTKFYEKGFRVSAPKVGKTFVEVVNEDCLETAVRLKREGFNPAVLNMASRRNPGGGVLGGAGAQEETLFRRTTLYRSLYQFAHYANEYGVPKSKHQYPLDRNYGGIYTPNALLFRKSEKEGYALMEEPVELSFISVAGMNRPDVKDGLIADYLVEPVKNKIRTILRIGLDNGHDSLVLGALGCGAFRNPPRHVARLFHEVIEEDEFAGRYKLLVFAILDDHNAHKAHNPEGNFKPFAEEFSGMGRITKEEMGSIMLWKLGLGHMGKYFNGENPMPPKDKTATKKSWQTEPWPEDTNEWTECEVDICLPSEAMKILRKGHIPEAQEDHWFMYTDREHIRYFRSWSGIPAFEAHYKETPRGYIIDSIKMNKGLCEFGVNGDLAGVALFNYLIVAEIGGDSHKAWDYYLSAWGKLNKSFIN